MNRVGNEILTVQKADNSVVALPNPQTMTVSIQDIDADGSGRNQSGTMFRDRVAVKRKLTCTFPPMGKTEMATLLSAITDQYFTILYPDPQTGTDREMSVYVGDRSAPVYYWNALKQKYLYQASSMNFVER